MLKDIYNMLDSPEQFGKDIVVPESSDKALYLSEDGELFCYCGVYVRGQRESSWQSWPGYLWGRHTEHFEKSIKGFFMIRHGCVLLTEFIDHDLYNNKKYKQLVDYVVRMPSSNSCRFGIEKRIETSTSVYFEENEELSRACFGLSYRELEYLVRVYAERLGIRNEHAQYPRITRSMNKQNFCDITGVWIPSKFPYVTFNRNGNSFSHVSLYGFYRHVRAMLAMGPGTKASKIFVHKTFCSEIIRQLKQINDYSTYETKVTRELLKCV